MTTASRVLRIVRQALIAFLLFVVSLFVSNLGLHLGKERFDAMIKQREFARSCDSVRVGDNRQAAMEVMEQTDYETASLSPSSVVYYTVNGGLECRLNLEAGRVANRSLGRR